MREFHVGDVIRGVLNNGLVVEVKRDFGHYAKIMWDDKKSWTYSFHELKDCPVIYPGPYHDFLDKIKDRYDT